MPEFKKDLFEGTNPAFMKYMEDNDYLRIKTAYQMVADCVSEKNKGEYKNFFPKVADYIIEQEIQNVVSKSNKF